MIATLLASQISKKRRQNRLASWHKANDNDSVKTSVNLKRANFAKSKSLLHKKKHSAK